MGMVHRCEVLAFSPRTFTVVQGQVLHCRKAPGMKKSFVAVVAGALMGIGQAHAEAAPDIVHFQSHELTLGGELFKPQGSGPFPAILYNHGSAPGMLNSEAARIIGPLFASKGWVFFMPYRRGQGLSSKAGAYIGDEISAARRRGGTAEAAATMTRLLGTNHLTDQLAALQWLKSQGYVQGGRIAVAGNSFGGVEAVLGLQNTGLNLEFLNHVRVGIHHRLILRRCGVRRP